MIENTDIQHESSSVKPNFVAARRDAFTVLNQKIARVRIIMTLLAHGRAREVLEDSDADELDWMLLFQVQEIEQAATDVELVIEREGKS